MEPGNAGDLWFGATSGDARDKPVFLTYFRSFKLGRDSDYRKLGGPKPSYQEGMKCWSLDATLRIIDPKVVLIGTDSGGAYPRDIVVLKKTKPKFWKCYQ